MAESDVMPGGQKQPAYFPLFMNISHKKFWVFGAGQIAARRIRGLIRFGADIVVVAPRIQEEIRRLETQHPHRLRLEERLYCPGELCSGNADYVLAATDNADVNTAIYLECCEKAIPANNAGDRKQCDFYFPALIEQENLVIGVTGTDGDHRKTARVSAALRQALAQTSDRKKKRSDKDGNAKKAKTSARQ